jgi:hypothetical protein
MSTNDGEREVEGCKHQGSCAMYSLFQHAGTLAVFQMRYCKGDFQECARFKRSSDGLAVPLNLMPNGQLLKKKA